MPTFFLQACRKTHPPRQSPPSQTNRTPSGVMITCHKSSLLSAQNCSINRSVSCVFCEISTGENTTWAGERGGGCWKGAKPPLPASRPGSGFQEGTSVRRWACHPGGGQDHQGDGPCGLLPTVRGRVPVLALAEGSTL